MRFSAAARSLRPGNRTASQPYDPALSGSTAGTCTIRHFATCDVARFAHLSTVGDRGASSRPTDGDGPRTRAILPAGCSTAPRRARRQASVHVTVGVNDSLLGTTLLGRYRILERIGAGAMGAVYRAEQVGLQRPVALKVLKKQIDSAADVAARFEREARAMSALAHPNTVRVYDFGSTEHGLLFLAMELLEGQIATDRLGAPEPPSSSDAILWVQQVLRSIGEAHAKGIVHRDIKPDNIFLARVEGEPHPIVKVLDFGIAKAVSGDHKLDQFETLDGTVFGTPRYMSPEQAQGKPIDHRSDLYAVGIVLYELLVGAPPFVDRDAVVVMAKHIREQPAPLRRAAPGRNFPASVQRVLDRALAKVPEARFQSAEAFDHALARCHRDAELLERTPRRGKKLMASALGAPRWVQLAALGGSTLVATAGIVSLIAASRPSSAAGDRAAAPISVPDRARAPASTTAEPAQGTRLVTLYTQPTRANVWRHGRFVGVTPLPIEVPAGRALRVQVSLEGYEPQTLDLAPGEQTRVIELARTRSEPPTLTRSERARPKPKMQRPLRRPVAGDSYEKF
jgi:eukaryotic-like serine/threonine-protein kinase